MLAQSELNLGSNKIELNLDEVLREFKASRLYSAFSAFATELKKHGYNVEIYSMKSLELYPDLTETRKNELAEYYENWLSWIQLGDIEIDRRPRREIEIEFAKRSLNHFGLHLDEKFWLTYTDEQVIEIYGPEMIQLYRSLNFFKLCGYSLLDISVFQWYVLWNRSKMIMESINSDVSEVMGNALSSFKFRVPLHLLLETLNTGDTINFQPRATEINFQHIACLKNSPMSSDAPSAFICTSKARTIAEGEEIENIYII